MVAVATSGLTNLLSQVDNRSGKVALLTEPLSCLITRLEDHAVGTSDGLLEVVNIPIPIVIGVFEILTQRRPFQIGHSVIRLDVILMIHGSLVVRVRYKGFGYESMHLSTVTISLFT